MGMDLKIGEFARRRGLTAKTVRYYELLGLLHEPQRTASGYRLYDEGDVQRLLFLRKAKDLGFSLTDVGETLAIAGWVGGYCPGEWALNCTSQW